MKPRLKRDPERAWSPEVVKMFVKEVRDSIGPGWSYLSQPMQEAMLAQKFTNVVLMQVRAEIHRKGMNILWQDMLLIAGLREEECDGHQH